MRSVSAHIWPVDGEYRLKHVIMDIPRTPTDHALMFVMTGLTNFACIPLLFLCYRRKAVFHFYIGFFTFLTSFMYHSLEALGEHSFYLTVSQWHRLDNIGSIMSLVMVVVNFMDNLDKDPTSNSYTSPIVARADYHLLYSALLVTLTMQTKHPWDLENTLVPILAAALIGAVKVIFIRGPRIDMRYVKTGVPYFLAAIYCFAKGLDEHSDYLRMHHGCWHLFSSVGIFYLWQSVDKMRPDRKLHISTFETNERFGLLTCLAHLLSLGYVPLTLDHKVKSGN